MFGQRMNCCCGQGRNCPSHGLPKEEKPKKPSLPRKFSSALSKFYKEHGVGRTTSQRLAYWNTTGQFGFSHNPTDKQKVAMHELAWLSDNFPMDFPSY